MEIRGSADRLFEVLQLPWMLSSKLRLICKATCHLAYALKKYADHLDPPTEVMPGVHIYSTEYRIVNNIESDAALRMNSVVTIIYYGLYLHTLSLSVCKEGILWSINGTGIMEMGLELFVFLNSFVLFSLARFGFQKSPTRNKELIRLTLRGCVAKRMRYFRETRHASAIVFEPMHG